MLGGVMSIHLIRSWIGQAGVLVFIGAGGVLVLASSSASGRRWAVRLMLLGVLLTVVASIVNRGWLP